MEEVVSSQKEKIKILLIDDSEKTRTLTEKVLASDFEVITTADWASANPYIFRGEIDLILLDVRMPGVKGDKIAQVLKETITVKPPKIVLFSALDETELMRKADEVGATGYIQKSFDAGVLRAKINRILKK